MIRPLVLALGVAAIAACTPPRGTEIKTGSAGAADSADQVFFGVQAPFLSNGVKRGTLYAGTLYVLNDQTRFDFKQGRVEFNTELGVPNGSMRADRGRYDQRNQILEGWGNVVVKTVDGKSLKSPHIVYNQRKNEISSDTTFEGVFNSGRNTGTGFTSDPNFLHYHCLSLCTSSTQVVIPK